MAKATGRRSPRSTWLLALLALIALAAALAQRAAAQDEADFDFDDDSNDIGADAGSFSEEQGGEDEVQPQLLALMIGAHEGNVEGVREVLDTSALGPDAVVDAKGFTPLMAAVAHGHSEVALLLIERGAAVNYICQVPGGGCYGQSAIHFAAMTGQADVIKKLIAAGADVNASVLGEWDPTSEDSMAGGFQPLQLAVGENKLSAVNALLEAGADTSHTVSNRGYTALDVALRMDFEEISRVLLAVDAPTSMQMSNMGKDDISDAVLGGGAVIVVAVALVVAGKLGYGPLVNKGGKKKKRKTR